jgi:glycosyltransferase involved in cell wall biosynthesis
LFHSTNRPVVQSIEIIAVENGERIVVVKVGYDGQAFLTRNGGTGKGAQLRTLLGPFIRQFAGFASTDPNFGDIPLIQEGLAGYNLWQQISLPGLLRRHGIDLFLAPSNTAPLRLPRKTKLALVLHDMIIMKNYTRSETRARFLDGYRRRLIPTSVARAEVVLTVSEHARQEILEAFPKANVRVISCTVPQSWFSPHPLAGRAGHILMVTSSAPHKNADAAIDAYVLYARRAGSHARPLKIVGLANHVHRYAPMLRASGLESLVDFLPFINEEQLQSMYQQAGALFFPSLDEGFGIPVLEAMATGTPVLTSRAASMPEVAGEGACYFDPSSVEDMASALERVLSDIALCERMAHDGLRQAQRFHPDLVRQKVIQFWKEIANVTSVT